VRRSSEPAWFDAAGMTAWVRGMARALGARVRLLDADGAELAAAGEGAGEAGRVPLEVSGRNAGWVEIVPAGCLERARGLVELATGTLAALAEARAAARDLVRATARQWRELSLLYRSRDLLRSGQPPEAIAEALLERALRAAGTAAGAVRFAAGEVSGRRERGEPPVPEPLLAWAEGLDGAVTAGIEELRRLGYRGPDPGRAVIAAPLADGEARFGAVVVLATGEGRISAEERKLVDLLASQAALGFANLELLRSAREAERLRRELEMAAEIQRWVLPAAEARYGWLEVAAVCRPAEWVGGDAYVHRPLAGGAVLVGVADVSGHGVPAALVTDAFATAVAAGSRETTAPGKLLELANELLCERVGSSGMFVTAVLAVARPGGACRIASAGHPPPLLTAGGAVRRLAAGGLPLGILAAEEYVEEEVVLPPGGGLVLYSDGVTEAADAGGALLGVEGLERIVAGVGGEDAGAVVSAIERTVARHAAGPQRDDLTVVAVRRTR